MNGEGTAGRFIPFNDIRLPLAAVENELCCNHAAVAVCSSEEQARQLAAMLGEIAVAGPADRGKLIGEHLDRWTDNQATAERYAELRKIVGLLRSSGCTLFLIAFLIGPALYFAPLRLPWQVVVLYFGFLVTAWMLAVWDYSACRKQLLGERFSRRFRHVGMLLLSPAGAMRAHEVLLRHSLAVWHPLAVAAALCRKDHLAGWPGRCCWRWSIPRLPNCPARRRRGASTSGFARSSSNGCVRWLGRAEIDVDELLQPPEPLYDSRSYCPRCRNQYVHAEGTCRIVAACR